MKAISFSRATFTLAGLSLLAACGGSATSISQSNPNFFAADVEGSVLSGAFNPQGYSAAQVRTLLGETCAGPLGGFNSQSQESGLVAFSATCAQPKNGARFVEYERKAGSTVLIEILGGDDSGNVTFNTLEVEV